MARIAKLDPGNAHSVNYLWGTTGIGYNVKQDQGSVRRCARRSTAGTWCSSRRTWPSSRTAACTFLDTPSEIIPIALNYLGEDPNSFDPPSSPRRKRAEVDCVRTSPSSTPREYINALANGDTCVAVGWSGDIFQAATRAEEANNGVEIAYVIPKEGAPMWFDMMAIPKDAKHPNNAHAFINFILRPEIAG